MTFLKGWRTMVVNALSAVLPILELTQWYDVMPDHWLPWYVLGLALANMWLRKKTTTPLGRRE